MTLPLDLLNKRFGRLFVLERAENNKHGKAMFRCQCDCGNTTIVLGALLKMGKTQSCGCLHRETVTKHGRVYANDRTYETWRSMHRRCSTVPGNKNGRWHAQRGIDVCQRWNDFGNFLADMGERPPGMSLDRIDNDGNYTPENCRWATPTEQNANKTHGNMYVKGR